MVLEGKTSSIQSKVANVIEKNSGSKVYVAAAGELTKKQTQEGSCYKVERATEEFFSRERGSRDRSVT